MKRFFAAILLTVACDTLHAADGYRIEGNIPGLPDGTLQLKKVFDGTVLHETVSKDGKFVFVKDGPFVGDKVNLAGAGISKAEVYLEPGTILVQRDTSGAIVATGTPSNDAYRQYLVEVMPYNARINQSAAAVREICLFGGAVMVLAFNARLSTRDVDGLFQPTTAIRDAARAVAGEKALPADWLNDGVKGFTSSRIPVKSQYLVEGLFDEGKV